MYSFPSCLGLSVLCFLPFPSYSLQSSQHPWWAQPYEATAVLSTGKLPPLEPPAPLPQPGHDSPDIEILNCPGQSEPGNTQNPLNSCAFYYHIRVFSNISECPLSSASQWSSFSSLSWRRELLFIKMLSILKKMKVWAFHHSARDSILCVWTNTE